MPSGGLRPTAPQNNTGVSATGGAGSKDGQPNRYVSGGGAYGASKALNEQQKGAPMSAGPAPTQAMPVAEPRDFSLQSPTNNPAEPVTAGVDFGPGPGSEALPNNISAETRSIDNKAIIVKYFPALLRATQLPDAPDSYKRFISYLSGEMNG